jgi:hypothetical protein
MLKEKSGGKSQYFTPKRVKTVARMEGPTPQYQAANAMAGKSTIADNKSPSDYLVASASPNM